MEEFNLTDAQNYLDTRDYLGYANYLRKFRASDNRKQEILNERINKYERLGNIQQAILENATEEEKYAYGLVCGLEGIGSVSNKENTNPFSKDYTNYINNLKDSNGNRINKIKLSYEKEDDFLELCNKLNVNKQDLYSRYGISVSNDPSNGNINLYIDVDNKKLPVILNEADFVQNSYNTEQITIPLAFGIKPYGVSTSNPYIYNPLNKFFVRSASISGILDDNTEISRSDFNSDDLFKAVGVYRKAKRIYDDLLINTKSENYDEQLHTTMFLGDGHRQMYEAWQNGAIKTTEYNSFVQAKTNQYNTLLKQTDLTQYKVFAAGLEDDNFTLREIDNPARLNVMKLLSAAMNDNRVTYSAGMVAGQLGTVITIAQSLDKNKELEDKEGGKFIRLFVPELFTKSAQESFNATNQGAAIVENSDMKTWNYGKVLHDGSKVGYDKKIGPYATIADDNGNIQKVPVDENYIINALSQEQIINRSVNKLYNLFDNEGNISKELLKGNSQADFLNNVINSLATASMDELYPKELYTTDERLYERDRLYRAIYKMLNNRLNNNSSK